MSGEAAVSNEPKRCLGINADGAPCGVGPELVLPSGFCFTHDAARQTERKAASTLGGIRQSKLKRRGLDPDRLGKLESPSDAARITSVIALAVATGELPAPAARAALVAITAFLRSYEDDVLDRRLDEAERRGKGGS